MRARAGERGEAAIALPLFAPKSAATSGSALSPSGNHTGREVARAGLTSCRCLLWGRCPSCSPRGGHAGRYPYRPHSRFCCLLSSPAALQGEGGLPRGAAAPAVLCRPQCPLWHPSKDPKLQRLVKGCNRDGGALLKKLRALSGSKRQQIQNLDGKISDTQLVQLSAYHCTQNEYLQKNDLLKSQRSHRLSPPYRYG